MTDLYQNNYTISGGDSQLLDLESMLDKCRELLQPIPCPWCKEAEFHSTHCMWPIATGRFVLGRENRVTFREGDESRVLAFVKQLQEFRS